jgi:hypothetical protein
MALAPPQLAFLHWDVQGYADAFECKAPFSTL